MKDSQKVILLVAAVAMLGLIQVPILTEMGANLGLNKFITPVTTSVASTTTTSVETASLSDGCPDTKQTTLQIRSYNPENTTEVVPEYETSSWLVYEDGSYFGTLSTTQASTRGTLTIDCNGGSKWSGVVVGSNTLRGRMVEFGQITGANKILDDSKVQLQEVTLPCMSLKNSDNNNISQGSSNLYDTDCGTDYYRMNSTAALTEVQAWGASETKDFVFSIKVGVADKIYASDEGASLMSDGSDKDKMYLGADFTETMFDTPQLSFAGMALKEVDCPAGVDDTYERCWLFPNLYDNNLRDLSVSITSEAAPDTSDVMFGLMRVTRFESTKIPSLLKTGVVKDDSGETATTTYGQFGIQTS